SGERVQSPAARRPPCEQGEPKGEIDRLRCGLEECAGREGPQAGSRRSVLSVRIRREPPSRRTRFPQGGIPMFRPSGQDRRARRPALERCEDRILQSIMAEPANNKATQPQETANTPDGSRIVVLYEAAPDHASRIFDDPFFFDAN